MHSTTKYLDGHNATVGGAVVSATSELHERIAFVQNATGTIMSPMVAWLTMQGIKTLAVRLDRQSDNALAVARYLEAHPKVRQVAYPGLDSFPQHDLAKRQAAGFGGMLWFEVEGGLHTGKQLMDAVEVWTLAENLGSVESLITHPATMTHAGISPDEPHASASSTAWYTPRWVSRTPRTSSPTWPGRSNASEPAWARPRDLQLYPAEQDLPMIGL